MTSLAVNNGWTPELIAMDKAMKEKYGPSAHITPAKSYAGIQKSENDSVEINAKKSDKKVASSLVKGGVALGGAYGIKKSLPHILSSVNKFLAPIRSSSGNITSIVDNGKPLKWLRDGLCNIDRKLFCGTSKLSKFVQKHFAEYQHLSSAFRVSAFATSCAKFAGIGLAIYGGYQLIKGVANAISNKVNKQ